MTSEPLENEASDENEPIPNSDECNDIDGLNSCMEAKYWKHQ